MPRLRHVALLIETSRGYGRGVLRGVAKYHAEKRNWLTYFQPHGLDDPPPDWLKHWRGHGVLARVDNRRMASALSALRVPVVNLRSRVQNLPFPFLGTDNRAVAELAVQHLLERGFQHFGFFGPRTAAHPGFAQRGHWFRHFVEQAGFACHVFQGEPVSARGRRESSGQDDDVVRWIKQLPKPVGVMAGNDDHGMRVLEACREVGIDVPEQVAVIGVDNDECLCSLSVPLLTSIELDCERIGYEAGALLDRLMAGRAAPRRLEQIKPRGVVPRESTDVLAVDDKDVVRAIRFIRQNACRGILVSDVFLHVGASRATFEAKLQRILRRTTHQEIQRIQIERARELLRESSLPIKQVAHEAGFSTVQYMTRVFGGAIGETPALFRRRHRLEGQMNSR